MKLAENRWEVVWPWPAPSGPCWPNPRLFVEYHYTHINYHRPCDMMDAEYFIELACRPFKYSTQFVDPTIKPYDQMEEDK